MSKKLSRCVDDNLEGSFGFSSEEENCNKETSDEKKLLNIFDGAVFIAYSWVSPRIFFERAILIID